MNHDGFGSKLTTRLGARPKAFAFVGFDNAQSVEDALVADVSESC